MARKYLRALPYTTGTNGRDIPIFLRLCYEFWGYCVNGTTSLTTPGGMPTTPTSGPTNFFEGTTVLATGSDGVTSSLGGAFTSASANFNSSMIGKYIVIWSPNSNSTDDSIYKIIGLISSTQLQLAVFSGGTPDISTLKNNLTSRSALNYRVIDPVAASQLSVASGNYFVGTFTDGYTINSGQANSQFQILLRGIANAFGQLGVVGSPTGTWNGSSFTGTTLTERIGAVGATSGAQAGVVGFITLIAERNFFIGHLRSPNGTSSASSYFFISIPQRFYSSSTDPNPLAILAGANNLAISGIDGISTAFGMVSQDGVTRNHDLLTKNLISDGVNGNSGTQNWTVGPTLATQVALPSRVGKILYSQALLSHSATINQFCLARAKLRGVAFTTSTIPTNHLVGDNGEYIHVGNGILFPWDGTILPFGLLPLGT